MRGANAPVPAAPGCVVPAEEARRVVLECVNGDAAQDAVIFAGTGTTGAIDVLSCILGCECCVCGHLCE